ncbi:MAG: hypothetical protein PVG83_03060 [Acidimicrobiia bacterium]|jgi:hypothetical protein
MSAAFPELDVVRVEVSAVTRDRHLSAIEAELASKRRPRGRRFRLMVVATAILLLLPVIALAAERTGPGDLLYPVRQVLERVSDVVGVSSSDRLPSDNPDRVSTIPPATTLTGRVTSTVPDDGTSSSGSETDRTNVDDEVRATDTREPTNDREPGGSTQPRRDGAGSGDAGHDGRLEPGRP